MNKPMSPEAFDLGKAVINGSNAGTHDVVEARTKHTSEVNQADMEIVKTRLRMAEKADTPEDREYNMSKAEESINKMDGRNERSNNANDVAVNNNRALALIVCAGLVFCGTLFFNEVVKKLGKQ